MKLSWQKIYPGVWQFNTADNPETLTHLAGTEPAKALQKMPETKMADGMEYRQFGNFAVMRFQLAEEEAVFGGGLLFKGVLSKNKVYHLKADHFGGRDNGRTHAPVPYIVTSCGRGLFCNTAEEVSLYIGTAQRLEDKPLIHERDRATDDSWSCYNAPYFVEVSVRSTAVSFIAFQGTSLKDSVARFNLYCGGGFIPPKWGLGLWHRTFISMTEDEIKEVAADYLQHDFPLSVIGLEPGWQSGSYPCTYDWSQKNFTNAEELIQGLLKQGIRVNIWENPYISEKSTAYQEMRKYAGSHLVWCGIVPDLTLPEAREALKAHHEKNHFAKGVSGYKLDESDGYDEWLWPDHAQFPSGNSAIAIRNSCGLMFQRLTTEIYRKHNQRTYGLTRSSNAGGTPFPYILYNDCYDFKDYLTGLCSCGFTGTLWCPELRNANTPNEWLRRFQLASLSPMLLLNAWACKATPWMFPEIVKAIRQAISLRQQLMPYLYSAFARYHAEGIPPWRSLFMDYGMFLNENKPAQGTLDDTANPYQLVQSQDITDQFIVGDTLMAAPIFPGADSRKIIFPPGKWYDFYTGKLVSEGGILELPCSEQAPLPLFAPDGAIVPMDINGTLQIRHFGTTPGSFKLYEDDGLTFNYEKGDCKWVELH